MVAEVQATVGHGGPTALLGPEEERNTAERPGSGKLSAAGQPGAEREAGGGHRGDAPPGAPSLHL